MEGFKKENSAEKKSSLVLDEEKVGEALWGKSIDSVAGELIKIFSIVKYIKEKGVAKRKEIEEIAKDLFADFEVSIFDHTAIFNNKVINQILESNEIDNISINFNDTPIIIKSGSSVESVVNQWEKAVYNSPKEIKARESRENKNRELVKNEQGIVDKMFGELDTLDFSNLEKVIDWLYEYNRHYINGVDIYKNELLKKFEENGYSAKKNDEIEFMLGETLKDKKRFGEAMVGFMLMNPGIFLRDNQMKDAINDWKKI